MLQLTGYQLCIWEALIFSSWKLVILRFSAILLKPSTQTYLKQVTNAPILSYLIWTNWKALLNKKTNYAYFKVQTHTLRKMDESTEKHTMDWNSQGNRRKGWPNQTLKRAILEESGKCGKTWCEVRRLAGNSQMEMLHKCPMLLTEWKDIPPPCLVLVLLLESLRSSNSSRDFLDPGFPHFLWSSFFLFSPRSKYVRYIWECMFLSFLHTIILVPLIVYYAFTEGKYIY
jgi:hypothetical protein